MASDPPKDSAPPKADFLSRVESASKIVGFITVGMGAVGVMLQYFINSEGEKRQKYLAELQVDIQIASLFNDLVQTANGYGEFSDPQQDIVKEIASAIPKEALQSLIYNNPKNLFYFFTGTRIPESVPLARQIAAAESMANLAIKYPVLLEPALSSFDIVVGLLPSTKSAYDRLCKHYSIDRPLKPDGRLSVDDAARQLTSQPNLKPN